MGLGEAILSLAKAISKAGETEWVLLEKLCVAAERRWKGRLRQGVTEEMCGEAFLCAAALTAAADLAGSREAGAVSGFTAGSVSIQTRSAAEGCAQAEALRKTAERLMAPFVIPDDFCFQGVRG